MRTEDHNNADQAWKGQVPLCFLELSMSERLSDTGHMCLCGADTS